jgi:formylglycine-generating enzyme required for sulfatase activity
VIPACTFLMGAQKTSQNGGNYDSEASPDEQPVHPVTLRSYEIARFPVTVAEYAGFVEEGGPLPGNWGLQKRHWNHPAVKVNWHEAVAYCEWLSRKTGRNVRLPTEAEWERAARGPRNTKYPWGDDPIHPSRANYFKSIIGAATPVGLYPNGANSERIFDLIGNVWEWCSDWYRDKGYGPDLIDNPQGPREGEYRVLRGGSWDEGPEYCRASYRIWFRPGHRLAFIGFRCVREL